MKTFVSTLSLLFIAAFSLFAQDSASLASSAAVQETQNVNAIFQEFPKEALTNSMISSLGKQGKALGKINSDGSIYVIGAATTAVQSNLPGFANSRNNAYAIAEMNAKMELLRLAGEQLTSSRDLSLLDDLIEGEDPDAKKKASILKKVGLLAHQSLDKALSYLGVSDEVIASLNREQKEALFQQNYSSTVSSIVAGMVKGCAVVRIAEGECGNNDYQLAVCLKYSPEFQSFAYSIKNGGRGPIPTSTGKDSRETILSMDESELIKRLGVWVTYDKEGEMVVYGFGQQEIRMTNSRQSDAVSRAYSQARLHAITNIKNFVAEDIVAQESQENSEKLREYADGSQAYFSRQKWENAISSKESTLNIAVEPVRQWRTAHPITGTIIAGYVVCWSPSHAKEASKIKQQLNSTSNPQTATKTTKVQSTTRSAIIITGDDDSL